MLIFVGCLFFWIREKREKTSPIQVSDLMSMQSSHHRGFFIGLRNCCYAFWHPVLAAIVWAVVGLGHLEANKWMKDNGTSKTQKISSVNSFQKNQVSNTSFTGTCFFCLNSTKRWFSFGATSFFFKDPLLSGKKNS